MMRWCLRSYDAMNRNCRCENECEWRKFEQKDDKLYVLSEGGWSIIE